ncbi:helix-turn-helix transcriptional regulator [Streptomyces shaanxiensis]
MDGAELAHRLGMSRTVFARRATHLVGQAQMAYVIWWRLSAAARILRDGDDPQAVVAQQIGYTSEFAFASAFKRAFGVAPGRVSGAHNARHNRCSRRVRAPPSAGAERGLTKGPTTVAIADQQPVFTCCRSARL